MTIELFILTHSIWQPVVARTPIRQNVLLPACSRVREHTHVAKRTLRRTRRLRSHVLMAWELLAQEHNLAFVALLVLVRILTFLDQVLVHLRDLDYLLALPARRQHGTLLPVMDIDRLLVEVLVERPAEIANLLVLSHSELRVLLPILRVALRVSTAAADH